MEGVVVRNGYDGQWKGNSWFAIVFYGMFRQKIFRVIIQGISARTFGTRLNGNLWEHVA